jgi:hypothetical protein
MCLSRFQPAVHRLADILHGFRLGFSLANATRQAGAFGYPVAVFAFIELMTPRMMMYSGNRFSGETVKRFSSEGALPSYPSVGAASILVFRPCVPERGMFQ